MSTKQHDQCPENRLSHPGINITVTGRKSGRPISIPVWFVLGKRHALSVTGEWVNTQWYKNGSEPSIESRPAAQRLN